MNTPLLFVWTMMPFNHRSRMSFLFLSPRQSPTTIKDLYHHWHFISCFRKYVYIYIYIYTCCIYMLCSSLPDDDDDDDYHYYYCYYSEWRHWCFPAGTRTFTCFLPPFAPKRQKARWKSEVLGRGCWLSKIKMFGEWTKIVLSIELNM